ncbi:hypothetical protein LTR99_009151 [Exophiala xenobiotica]|uniref:Alb1-domain-containing protein n=1 Tax=Vermiconidia calcicola TaxID=1690605 RepID=A0AAV9Q274_9PEZI|nr:hypothetical protein LTR92_000895 [Exophiala xenobiotica]KAK5531657.1 hypothetical protein LTR23_009850 [Chaetothyriales sp. CCFEE 6169]KAK5532417.1 hypothetical protein LTR25_007950 [Vermiconidia calcicola]KAK5264945.1 hypothetical protein LTR96_009744 [Exophiala xenobiotica]KAK5295562.1 hypothetical protein LTR99_009151 [Exophiala xenobiotica]
MAKTAKVKKNATANPRSRASKRATSPSIDVDKSVKNAPRASDATPVLAARPASGVTKSKSKQKPLTRGQRRRHEKGLARAEVVQDRLSKKADEAVSKLKKIRDRAKLWDDVNTGATKFDKVKAVVGENIDGDEWVDEEMDDSAPNVKIVEGVQLPVTAPATKLVVVDRTASAPTTDMEDEIEKIT